MEAEAEGVGSLGDQIEVGDRGKPTVGTKTPPTEQPIAHEGENATNDAVLQSLHADQPPPTVKVRELRSGPKPVIDRNQS